MAQGATMVCSRCGTENDAGRKFCMECAAPLARLCSVCGAANDPRARFCGECASPLADGAPATTPWPPAATIGPVASASAADERRLVSVLFADLVGFTALSEHRDA